MPELDPNNPAIQNAPQTGEPAQSAINWDADDNPWKRNFESYRTEADRRATKLSQYESLLEDLRSPDIERQRRAAAELQVELVEEEPVDYGDDPTLAELNALKQQHEELNKRLTAREQRDELAELSTRIDAKMEALGLSDENDEEWVLARAVALGKGEDGLPKIKEAFDQLQQRDNARLEAQITAWREGKLKALTSIQPGKTGTETKSVADMDDNERIEWAAQRLADMQ